MEENRPGDFYQFKALQDLGSTMSFSTLVEADKMSNLALGMAIEFTRSSRGYLLLLSPQGRTRYAFGIDLSESSSDRDPPEAVLAIMERARQERKAVLADGAAGGRPQLCVPMIVDDEVVGVLYLDRAAGGESFQEGEVKAADLAAGQLGISITARFLYEQMTEKRKQVELIDKVSKAVNTPVDLENVLSLVVDTARQGLRAQGGALLLAEDAGPLRVRASVGLEEGDLLADGLPPAGPSPADRSHAPLPIAPRLIRRVLREGVPQVHPPPGAAGAEAQESPAGAPASAVAVPVKLTLRDKRVFNERRRTAYAVPFSKVLGVLYLETRDGEEEFTDDDVFVLQVFADHITTAVMNDALYQQASTDSLTGLASRRYLDTRLQDEVDFARRTGTVLSLLLADLDDFKSLNDTHGHQAGDEILRQVGTILRRSVRKFDICGRYGGEEFILALPETDTEGARVVAENVRERVAAERFLDSEEPVRATVSVGIATYPTHAEDVHGLVGGADRALYDAKSRGKNRHSVATAAEEGRGEPG